MKRFIIYVTILIVMVVSLQYLGEYTYTYVYNHGSPRNKVMWVRDIGTDSLDYVVIGNSRSYYHINPVLIEQETGEKGLNLAYVNSYPFELKLMTLEVLKNIKVQKIFIQVDYTYNLEIPDKMAQVPWIPYLKEKSIYSQYKNQDSQYKFFRWIPFYRYQYYESELGFRNVVLSMLGKKPNFYENYGFKPIHGQLQKLDVFEHYLIDKENILLSDILGVCSNLNTEVYFFTAPIFQFKGNLDLMERWLPNYNNYTELIQERSLFSDPVHLKEEGAIRFTHQFIEDYFTN